MTQSTKSLDQDILRQLLNLVAILAAFGFNVLANVAPINGLSIGAIAVRQSAQPLLAIIAGGLAIALVILLLVSVMRHRNSSLKPQ